MANMKKHKKDKRTEIISIKCTKSERESFIQNSRARDITVSTYLVECGVANKEPRKSKDKKRTTQMVLNQQTFKELEKSMETLQLDKETEILMDKLKKGLELLWDY